MIFAKFNRRRFSSGALLSQKIHELRPSSIERSHPAPPHAHRRDATKNATETQDSRPVLIAISRTGPRGAASGHHVRPRRATRLPDGLPQAQAAAHQAGKGRCGGHREAGEAGCAQTGAALPFLSPPSAYCGAVVLWC